MESRVLAVRADAVLRMRWNKMNTGCRRRNISRLENSAGICDLVFLCRRTLEEIWTKIGGHVGGYVDAIWKKVVGKHATMFPCYSKLLFSFLH